MWVGEGVTFHIWDVESSLNNPWASRNFVTSTFSHVVQLWTINCLIRDGGCVYTCPFKCSSSSICNVSATICKYVLLVCVCFPPIFGDGDPIAFAIFCLFPWTFFLMLQMALWNVFNRVGNVFEVCISDLDFELCDLCISLEFLLCVYNAICAFRSLTIQYVVWTDGICGWVEWSQLMTKGGSGNSTIKVVRVAL